MMVSVCNLTWYEWRLSVEFLTVAKMPGFPLNPGIDPGVMRTRLHRYN
jgi:hypothetical protein